MSGDKKRKITSCISRRVIDLTAALLMKLIKGKKRGEREEKTSQSRNSVWSMVPDALLICCLRKVG